MSGLAQRQAFSRAERERKKRRRLEAQAAQTTDLKERVPWRTTVFPKTSCWQVAHSLAGPLISVAGGRGGILGRKVRVSVGGSHSQGIAAGMHPVTTRHDGWQMGRQLQQRCTSRLKQVQLRCDNESWPPHQLHQSHSLGVPPGLPHRPLRGLLRCVVR
jgi:hypothetical protein